MSMPRCDTCGKSDPRSMIGLTTLVFGSLVERRLEPGYFYLCPECFRARVLPHLDAVVEKVRGLPPRSSPEEQPEPLTGTG